MAGRCTLDPPMGSQRRQCPLELRRQGCHRRDHVFLAGMVEAQPVSMQRLLYGAILISIAANLTLGITFSSIARNQLQAMQMTFFFFLPSMLLSGFMFPFRGMPNWAQWLGEILPLTHFLRIVRGILLKGNGTSDIAPELWPLAAFLAVVAAVAMLRYRRTLD